MADETNVHVKLAMADVMGLLVVSMFTFAVAGFGLGAKGDMSMLDLVVAIGPFVGIASLIVAIVAFMNENILATAIFGPLAVFFFAIVMVGGQSAALLCMVIGIIILIDALVALAQPVKLLPVLLIVAAVAFFVTSVWYDATLHGNSDDYRMIVGVLWLIYSLISFYMAAAIMMLVMKGKQVLPLLIKA